ncbi:MAG: hypothetical protein IH793_08565 [Acidobacteria bacterium]|nr:hypothetical protein [Acidobacteriota bacterium]
MADGVQILLVRKGGEPFVPQDPTSFSVRSVRYQGMCSRMCEAKTISTKSVSHGSLSDASPYISASATPEISNVVNPGWRFLPGPISSFMHAPSTHQYRTRLSPATSTTRERLKCPLPTMFGVHVEACRPSKTTH